MLELIQPRLAELVINVIQLEALHTQQMQDIAVKSTRITQLEASIADLRRSRMMAWVS